MSKTNNRTVFEVAIKTDPDDIGKVEILHRVLKNAGIAENEIVECEQWPHMILSVYFKSKTKAHLIKRKIQGFALKKIKVDLKTLEKKDWQTKWKEEFKPFSLTKTFGVIPLWMRNKRRLRGKRPIYIDTDLAFGTGLHATTRFMAQLIERCRGRFKDFLDLGTGTGLLAIIAAKCGATDVKAIDISADAVKVAKRNCVENDCLAINIKWGDVQKSRIKKQFDFVAANIITRELIRLSDKIVGFVKPGKYLAVSGVSLGSYDVFRRAYARYPLRCLKVEKGEGWVAILYQKTKNKK